MAVASCILAAIFALAGVICLHASLSRRHWLFDSSTSVLGALPRKAARPVAALLGLAVLGLALTIVHDTFPSLF